MLPAQFVRRPALVQHLIDAREASLALIIAPPGYGKSALLSDWAEHDERPFMWLADAERELVGRRTPEPSDRVTALVQTIRTRHRSFVLVLDDAHLSPPVAVRDMVGAALASLPAGSAVALTSRTAPSFPIGRLRAHRKLVEVETSDLAMTPAEAAILLHAAGLELEFEAVQALVRRTEGWPAALYLAALSLIEQPDAADDMTRFLENDHFLTDYVYEEILSALPPELRGFAVRTSVLETLSGAACDAVLRQTGSARLLAALARASQLLVPLDRSRERFRWHQLVRESLRAELRGCEPESERPLHRRASTWYSRRGDAARAIEHSVAAADSKRTGDLLWGNIPGFLANGRLETVGRWLGAFTDDRIGAYPPLSLCAAHHSLFVGNVADAQHWATVAAAGAQRAGRKSQAPSLATGIAVVEAMIAKAGAAEMGAIAARAYELEPPDSDWRPILCFLRGTATYLTGDRAAAARSLREGIDSARAAPGVLCLCLAQLAMIAIEQEDWDAAGELADRAEAVTEAHRLETRPICALVFAAVALVRAHQGRADEAKHALQIAINLLASLGDFTAWYGAGTRILLAHASVRLADVVRARALLAEASRLARRIPDAAIFGRWFDEAWAYLDTLAETSLAGPSSLTIAELRILRFMPSHRSCREIASQLGVSANTVKAQAHAIYRKLGVASRSEAVARASEAGLLGQ